MRSYAGGPLTAAWTPVPADTGLLQWLSSVF
jgi:hypothetical protein